MLMKHNDSNMALVYLLCFSAFLKGNIEISICSGLLDVDSALESHLKHPKEVVLSNNGTASIAVYYHRPSQQIIVP